MGQDLLKNLIQATGISEDLISPELKNLTARAGLSEDALTIEDLRLILAEYVQEVLLSAKEQFDSENAVEPIEALKASILPLDA
jgi:hypothetical protein